MTPPFLYIGESVSHFLGSCCEAFVFPVSLLCVFNADSIIPGATEFSFKYSLQIGLTNR